MLIKIVPNDQGNPPGKLADVEIHFTDGPLAGLKLIGFGMGTSRGRRPERDVSGLAVLRQRRTPRLRLAPAYRRRPGSGCDLTADPRRLRAANRGHRWSLADLRHGNGV